MDKRGGYELQTDRLRQETGASRITCRVLHHNPPERQRLTIVEALVYEIAIPQSVAYTLLAPASWPAKIRTLDRLMRYGSLMGETFRSHGFEVRQNRLFRARMPILNKKIARLYQCSRFRLTEVECYEFWVSDILYGTVFEIKAPGRRQAPTRRRLGSYHALRFTGVSDTLFHQWLRFGAPIHWQHRPLLVLARIWGFLQSVRLYFHTRLLYTQHMPDYSLTHTSPR